MRWDEEQRLGPEALGVELAAEISERWLKGERRANPLFRAGEGFVQWLLGPREARP